MSIPSFVHSFAGTPPSDPHIVLYRVALAAVVVLVLAVWWDTQR